MRKNYSVNDREKISFSLIKDMFWGYKKVFVACPEFVIAKIVMAIMNAVLDLILSVFLLAFLLNCIEEQKSLSYALTYLAYAAGYTVFYYIVIGIFREVCFNRGQDKILRNLTSITYEKAVKMDMSFYDDPKFYNDFVWAMNDAPKQIVRSFEFVHWLIYTLITILITGVYVATSDKLGIIVVVASVVVRVILHMYAVKHHVKMEKEKKPPQRKRDYINRVFYLSDFAKDIRLSDIKKLLFKDYDKSSEEIEGVIKKHSKIIILLTHSYYLVTTVVLNLYLIWLLYGYFFLGTIATLGTVVSLHNAINRLSNSLTSLANVIPEVQRTGLYIQKMRRFLNAENLMPDEGKEEIPERFDIDFKNVSFAYPSTDKEILKNINLHIPQGSKIALVGYNGAGKSTLVKLMMRLYDPTSGEITLGGKSITEYPVKDYRANISPLFQDFQIMAATLGENITMSDEEIDKEKAEKMLELTGFTPVYNRLNEGLDTMLTKEFNPEGINFSGGESQKLAIARVLYSDAKLLILDEPSAALDPLSEYTLNHTINELAADRTIIFISHRLSTTRVADKIYMLENGEIIEEGTHDELINKNGKYAKMFLLQAQKYR